MRVRHVRFPPGAHRPPHRPITHPRLFAPKSRGSSGTTSFPSRWPRRAAAATGTGDARVDPTRLGSHSALARSLPDTPNSNPRGRSTRVHSHIRAPRRRAPARRMSIARSALEAPCQTTRVNQHPLQFFSSAKESRKPHLHTLTTLHTPPTHPPTYTGPQGDPHRRAIQKRRRPQRPQAPLR